ncbi:endonuclease/exonuclease/phosphatase family protein [Escherichia coli]|uniref:endonuclease/exonuclease/phosphatase family protein n=1 Tax=Escherichia coli TaxID=562 RepID=UPI0039673AD9
MSQNRTKFTELEALLESNHIDVACITETHLNPNKNLFIPNFTIYRKDRPNSQGGGVAVLVRN